MLDDDEARLIDDEARLNNDEVRLNNGEARVNDDEARVNEDDDQQRNRCQWKQTNENPMRRKSLMKNPTSLSLNRKTMKI